MKKVFFLLTAIWMMAATQQVVAQTLAEKAKVEFTSQIGDPVIYSVVELTEFILFGSDNNVHSILDEYKREFPYNCGVNAPEIIVLEYEGEFICLQRDADGDIITICMKTEENGWIECDPNQENLLWKLTLLEMFALNLLGE